MSHHHESPLTSDSPLTPCSSSNSYFSSSKRRNKQSRSCGSNKSRSCSISCISISRICSSSRKRSTYGDCAKLSSSSNDSDECATRWRCCPSASTSDRSASCRLRAPPSTSSASTTRWSTSYFTPCASHFTRVLSPLGPNLCAGLWPAQSRLPVRGAPAHLAKSAALTSAQVSLLPVAEGEAGQ